MSESSVVKSVARVFEVFECFAKYRTPMSSSDIAKALGYPNSSTLMLLKSMTQLGYLSTGNPAKTYFPTPRLRHLTSWVDMAVIGTPDLTSMLLELRDTTDETVTLSVQRDLEMVFIEILPSTQPISLSIREGSSRTLDSSTVGIAALSALDDVSCQSALNRLERLAHRSDKNFDRADLLRRITAAKVEGHAIGYGLVGAETGAIAAPIRSADGDATYVVGVGGPAHRVKENEAEIVKALKHVLQTNLINLP